MLFILQLSTNFELKEEFHTHFKVLIMYDAIPHVVAVAAAVVVIVVIAAAAVFTTTAAAAAAAAAADDDDDDGSQLFAMILNAKPL